jgi:twitching motility two-component system response regulator PilH
MAKILIVDDSATYRLRLRQLVHRLGHEAVLAHDGEEGLEKARADAPDVILMDIVMPGMSGYQAKRKLSASHATRHIPVIFVTSKTGEADRTWGLRQGAREYITKPVNPNYLLSAISEAVAA